MRAALSHDRRRVAPPQKVFLALVCLLLASHCPLVTAYCPLVTAHCPLPTAHCLAQCIGGSCPISPIPHRAVVRVVYMEAGGVRSYGSGTLVSKAGGRGIVLTCAHVFGHCRPSGNTVVTFRDGRRFAGNLVALDQAWDLAALEIEAPDETPVPVAQDPPRPGDQLQSCGYGPDGHYRCNRGRALGYVRAGNTPTRETLELSGWARDGDSGGPVFNARGQLAAVLWGTNGRVVGGTYCGRIRKFLAAIIKGPSYPGGHDGNVRPTTPADDSHSPAGTTPCPPSGPVRVADHLDKIRRRLDLLDGSLKNANQRLGNQEHTLQTRLGKLENLTVLISGLKSRIETAEAAAGSDNLRAVAREVAIGVLAERGPNAVQSILPAVLVALGWTGPPSIALLFALRLAAALLRRRVKKRMRTVPRDESRSPPDPKPLNDQYAEQLARLYALSGRSPMADVTLGREYDQELRQAEQSSDATLARWARKLRERVAGKLYRIHAESPLPAEPVTGES